MPRFPKALTFGAIILVQATCIASAHAQAMEAPFGAVALPEDTLASVAGREDSRQISTASQVAGVSQNSVGDHVQTGDAKISGNSFQNMSGLSILNVNTGNNVAINAAMNVNIAIAPPQP